MTRREYWDQRIGPDRSFGTSDVARICDVSQRSVQRWIQEGRLFALASSLESRYGARVPREALIEFLILRTPMNRYPSHVEV